MALQRALFVDWRSVNGSAQGKRKLVLRENDKGAFTCPVNLCLHAEYMVSYMTKNKALVIS